MTKTEFEDVDFTKFTDEEIICAYQFLYLISDRITIEKIKSEITSRSLHKAIQIRTTTQYIS